MNNDMTLTTLLNLTNIIMQQQSTISELNNQICEINKKLDLLLNNNTNNYTNNVSNNVNNNNKITRNVYTGLLINKLKELQYNVILPCGRINPYIILNNKIKIWHGIAKINKYNIIEILSNTNRVNDVDFFIIGCIDNNDECNHLILNKEILNQLYEPNNKLNTKKAIKLFIRTNGDHFFNTRTQEQINVKYNDFELLTK